MDVEVSVVDDAGATGWTELSSGRAVGDREIPESHASLGEVCRNMKQFAADGRC